MTYTELDQDAGLRASLSFIARHHKAEDIVQILGEVISDESFSYAIRTGDYERAADLSVIARYLEKLDNFIEDYDPTPE